MRWGIRLSGLVSTIVLVRLLESGDFGVVAMAMAVVTLVDQLTDFGISWVLVRDKRATPDQFDTAWSIRLGQMALVAIVVAALAPAAATFYEDPRIAGVLWVIALSIFVRGFENIGVVDFQRQLQFDRDFRFRVSVKVVSVVVTIGLAVWLRSYWALAIGMLANNIVSVVLSYGMSEYRPRWTLIEWQKIWGFSRWMLSQGVAKYIFESGPVLFLGRVTDATSVGYYSIANEVSAVPVTEVSMPVSRAVLPGFAQLIDERKRLEAGFLKAFSAVATVTLPLGLGMAWVAPEMVRVALGDGWLPTVTLVQILAIFATCRALDSLSRNLLVVLDKVRTFATISWLQALLLIAGIAPAYSAASLDGVAALRTCIAIGGLTLMTHAIVRADITSWKSVFEALLRPIIASASMVGCLVALEPMLPVVTDAMSAVAVAPILLAKVTAGALAYTVVLYFSWTVAGRPDGLEAMVWEKLASLRA